MLNRKSFKGSSEYQRKTKGGTKEKTKGDQRGNHLKNHWKITENQKGTIENQRKFMQAHGIPMKSLRKSSRNLKNIKRKTEGGTIGKTKGSRGETIGKRLGHHWKIKGKLMESNLDC